MVFVLISVVAVLAAFRPEALRGVRPELSRQVTRPEAMRKCQEFGELLAAGIACKFVYWATRRSERKDPEAFFATLLSDVRHDMYMYSALFTSNFRVEDGPSLSSVVNGAISDGQFLTELQGRIEKRVPDIIDDLSGAAMAGAVLEVKYEATNLLWRYFEKELNLRRQWYLPIPDTMADRQP
jgi:hypothetical protein